MLLGLGAGFVGLALIALMAGALLVRPPLAPLSPWMQLCLACAALWTGGEVIAAHAADLTVKRIGLWVLYTGSIFLPACWLVTVMRWVRLHAPPDAGEAGHTGNVFASCTRLELQWIPLLLAAAFWLGMATDPWHGRFVEPVVGGRNVYQTGFQVLLGVAYGEVLLAAALCLALARARPAPDVRRASLLLAAAPLPSFVANLAYVLLPAALDARWTGVVLTLSVVPGVAALWWGRALWLLPVALAEIVRRDRSGILLLDRERRPVYCNPAAERLLGAGADATPGTREAFDRLAQRLVPAEAEAAHADGGELLGVLLRAGASGRVHRDRARHDTWLRLQAIPVGTGGGGLATAGQGGAAPLALRIEDVSEAVRSERARRAMAERVLEVERLRGVSRLASETAHHFNNRLAVILGNLGFLREDAGDDPGLAPLLADIEQATDEAVALTRQLLVVAGRALPVAERVDLREVVDRVLAALAATEGGTLALEVDAPTAPGALPDVEADPRQLEQALLALARSARARMGPGPGRLAVTLRALGAEHGSGRDRVEIALSDDAPALAEAQRRALAGAFGLDDAPGSGIELAVGLLLLRANRGALAVEAPPGGGNRVRVVLPAAEPAAGLPPLAVGAGDETDREWTGSGLALVIDDDEPVRRLAAGMLERLGFRVATAADGETGLARIEAAEAGGAADASLRVVLLDLLMPGLPGSEVLREIEARAPGLPVVVTTGRPDGDEDPALAQVGEKAAGILVKPYSLDALRSALRRALAE